MTTTRFAGAALATLLTTAAAQGAPTPLPGGANQIKAVSGTLGQTVWNGALRITFVDVREATAAETAAFAPIPGKKVLVFDMKLRNGTSDSWTDLIEYSFADKDDVSVDVPTGAYTHANLHIVQGGAAVQHGIFSVDSDFVPTKLIVVCATCGTHSPFKSVRFSIPQH